MEKYLHDNMCKQDLQCADVENTVCTVKDLHYIEASLQSQLAFNQMYIPISL